MPKSRLKFEQAFYDAEEEFNETLINGKGPVEAAKLLWEAERRKQPWAIQELWRQKVPSLCGKP
jgi:hypothetical protein